VEILSDVLLPQNPDLPLEAATKAYVDAVATVGGAAEWAVYQPWGIGSPTSWDWGAVESYLRLNLVYSSGKFGNPGSGGGGYGQDISLLSTAPAGPYRLTADLSGLSAAHNFWIIRCQQIRGGATIRDHSVVSGGSATEWTTASAENIFDAQPGDLFRWSCNSGGGIWTLDNRSWLTIASLKGVKGDQGIQGPPGAIEGLPTVEAWQTPTLINSWANYGAANNPAGYFKDPFGIVHLRGLVKNGTPIPSDIFTLPAGYRPFQQELHVTISNGLIGYAQVNTAGGVRCQAGNASYFSIDGITFRAYQ
jgi:hypothetical protein